MMWGITTVNHWTCSVSQDASATHADTRRLTKTSHTFAISSSHINKCMVCTMCERRDDDPAIQQEVQPHRARQAERRAVLHLQYRQVQSRAGVDGRVVRAALDAALQVPLCQDPQGAPGRRTLHDVTQVLQKPRNRPLADVISMFSILMRAGSCLLSFAWRSTSWPLYLCPVRQEQVTRRTGLSQPCCTCASP